jgi:hypothetical protein
LNVSGERTSVVLLIAAGAGGADDSPTEKVSTSLA